MNAAFDEIRLIRSCLSGERGAWDTFVEKYAPFIYSAVNKALRKARPPGPEETERAFSEVFYEILKNDFQVLRSFSGRSKFTTYLYVVALRKCAALRKEAPFAEAGPDPDTLEAGEPEPVEAAWTRERAEIVNLALAKLPQRDRDALDLFYFKGLAYSEIGRALGVSPEHAGMVVKRAKDKLRALLRKQKDSLL